MSTEKAKTPNELVEAAYRTENVISFVPRKLLIETVGVDMAQRFLPELPEYVAVNVEDLLLVLKVVKPELLSTIMKKVDNEQSSSNV